MKRISLKNLLAIFILALVLGSLPVEVFAERMSSSNYTLESDSMNFAGARSTSGSYSLEDTAGETVNFRAQAIQ